MVEPRHARLSVRRQCELLELNRSGWYEASRRKPSEQDVETMRQIDRIYTQWPWYGSRRIGAILRREGTVVNRKRLQRLMRCMGIEGVRRRRSTSKPAPGHMVFPYLLRGLEVERPDQVWCADITYVPMAAGSMYLVAVMDWYSRYVVSWELSNSLDSAFCVEAVRSALLQGRPEIFNTDQGCQFTSQAFVGMLQQAGVRISMDGRGRALDNVFIERLWRSVKHEDVYVHGYETVPQLYRGLIKYFRYYNEQRPHQGLADRTPGEVYRSRSEPPDPSRPKTWNPEGGRQPRNLKKGGLPAEEEVDLRSP